MRRILGVVVAAVLVAAGCSSDGSDGARASAPTTEAPTGGSSTTAEPAANPPATFAEAACPATVPADAGVEVTCGYLSVPENRQVAGSNTIKLAVARIHSRSKTPLEPVVGLGGGPGFPEVEGIAKGLTGSPLLDEHDYIAWDERGTGFSTPSLDCPETNEAVWEQFRTTDPDAEEGDRLDASIEACKDRLEDDGVDLSGYNTTEVVQDLDDLRTALGIESWNLYGGSYGTSVALEALRQDLPGIHSVLIDSVQAPDEPFGAVDRGKSAQRAFEALYAACAAQASCQQQYGDLEALVAKAVASLDADPYRATIQDEDGKDRQIALTGQDFTAGLFRALYDPTLIPAVPGAIASVAKGDRSIIGTLASASIPFASGAAEAMTTSVNCADRGRLLDPDAVEPYVAEHPELAALVYVQNTEARCPGWDVPEAPKAFNALPAAADVPVMVAAGAFDPITPPAGAQRVADALGVELLTFPDAGHGAIGPSPCSVELYLGFLADPEAELDTACIGDLQPPTFG